MKAKLVWSIVVVTMVLNVLSANSFAAEYTWINSDGGDWSDSNNWQGGLVPVNGADTIVNVIGSSNSEYCTINIDIESISVNKIIYHNTDTKYYGAVIEGGQINLIGDAPVISIEQEVSDLDHKDFLHIASAIHCDQGNFITKSQDHNWVDLVNSITGNTNVTIEKQVYLAGTNSFNGDVVVKENGFLHLSENALPETSTLILEGNARLVPRTPTAVIKNYEDTAESAIVFHANLPKEVNFAPNAGTTITINGNAKKLPECDSAKIIKSGLGTVVYSNATLADVDLEITEGTYDNHAAISNNTITITGGIFNNKENASIDNCTINLQTGTLNINDENVVIQNSIINVTKADSSQPSTAFNWGEIINSSITINDGGVFTNKIDSAVNKLGKITNGSITVNDGGTFVFEGGTVSADTVCAYNTGGTLDVTGGVYIHDIADTFDSATLNLSGGEFCNYGTMTNATANITGGTLVNASTTGSITGGTINIIGSTFSYLKNETSITGTTITINGNPDDIGAAYTHNMGTIENSTIDILNGHLSNYSGTITTSTITVANAHFNNWGQLTGNTISITGGILKNYKQADPQLGLPEVDGVITGGSIEISAGHLRNETSITGTDITLTVSESTLNNYVHNWGTITGGTVTLNGGHINNYTGANITDSTITFENSSSTGHNINNWGEITNCDIIIKDGVFYNKVTNPDDSLATGDGVITDGSIEILKGYLRNEASITGTDITLSNSESVLTNYIHNLGTITGGTVTLNGGHITNFSAGTFSGNTVTISGGHLNSWGILENCDITVTSGKLANAAIDPDVPACNLAGRITNSTIEISSSGTFYNQTGASITNSEITVDNGGKFYFHGGTISADTVCTYKLGSTLNVEAGTYIHDAGDTFDSATLNITGGEYINNGTMSAPTVNVLNSRFANSEDSGIISGGEISVNGDPENIQSAYFHNFGEIKDSCSITIEAGHINNYATGNINNSTLEINKHGTANWGDFENVTISINSSGYFYNKTAISSDISLNSNGLISNCTAEIFGGTLRNDMDAEISGSEINLTNGLENQLAYLSNTGNINSSTIIVNSGKIDNYTGGKIKESTITFGNSNAATHHINNWGDIENSNITMNGGVFSNQANTQISSTNSDGVVSGGSINLTGGWFQNLGMLKETTVNINTPEGSTETSRLNNSNAINDTIFVIVKGYVTNYDTGTITGGSMTINNGYVENRGNISGVNFSLDGDSANNILGNLINTGEMDDVEIDLNNGKLSCYNGSSIKNSIINLSQNSVINWGKTENTELNVTGGYWHNVAGVEGNPISGSIENSSISLTGGYLVNQGTIEQSTVTIDAYDGSETIARLNNDGTVVNTSVVIENGYITTSENSSITGGSITANNGGTVKFRGGTISADTVCTYNSGSTLNVEAGIYTHDSGDTINGATLNITGGEFYNGLRQASTGTIAGSIVLGGGASLALFVNNDSREAALSGASLRVKNNGKFIAVADSKVESFSLEAGAVLETTLNEQNSLLSAKKIYTENSGEIQDNVIVSIKRGQINKIVNDQKVILATAASGLLVDSAKLILDSSDFDNTMFKLGFTLGDDNKNLYLNYSRAASYEKIAIAPNKSIAKTIDNIIETRDVTEELEKLIVELDQTPDSKTKNICMLELQPRQQEYSYLNARATSADAAQILSRFLATRRLALRGVPYKLTIDPAVFGLASTNSPASLGSSLAQVSPKLPGERVADREIGMDKIVSVYGRATSGYTRVGASSERIGLRASKVGGLVGFDVRVHENVILGFAGSYDYSDINYMQNLGNGQVNSYRFGPYAMVYAQNWFFQAEATIGLHENKFDRRVSLANETAKSDYDAIDFSVQIGAGVDLDIGGINVTPSLNIQYQFYQSDAFDEKNAPSAALHVDRYDTSAISSRLGIEIWKRFEFDSKIMQSATPFLNVGWRKEWLAPTNLTSQFIGGGDAFNTDNDLYSRNAIYLGIGSTFELTDSLNLDLNYQVSLGDRDNQSQYASINLRWKF